ncbi:hypothetical protein L208DRAFT_1376484 [Tricholoma matsutake]|nr:hypothetical protein L208DRAFT_1376484 [Tricholoma matsutake 945]
MPSTDHQDDHTFSHARAVVKELKSSGNGKSHKLSKVYYNAAQWIPLGIDPFISVPHVMYAYIHGEATNEEYEIFQRILNLVPTFETVLLEFVKESGFLGQFISKLSLQVVSLQQDDTGSIRYTALGYILFNTKEHLLDPPITKANTKSSHGFNHLRTTCLLCPIKRLNEFDDNPMLFMTKVNDSQINIKASSWPSFMYDEVEFDGEWVLCQR